VGHPPFIKTLMTLHQRAQWQYCRWCACNGSRF